MYTVCIAEDEYYVQKSIEARIHALSLDLEIKGIAENGIEAEEIYYKYHPDLFFVDISMPLCNGLEFIEKVRRKDSETNTVFIIVSSYYDYENMRKAINVNVFDYLRKPIIPADFADIVQRAIRQVENQRKESHKVTEGRNLEEYLSVCQNRKVDGTWLILLKRKTTKAFLPLKNELLQLGEASCILPKNISQIEILLFENQIIEEWNVERLVLEHRDSETVVFYRQFSKVEIEQDLKIAEAKMSCCYFRKKRFYSISGIIKPINFDNVSYMLQNQNLSDIRIHIESLWNETAGLLDGEYLSQFYKQYLFCLVKRYDEEKIVLPEQLKRDLLLFSMFRFDTMDEIKQYLEQSTFQYLESVKENRPMELIDQITEYIHINYAEPLNLNDLATLFYISPSYLSHLFAKKKQMAIVKYIGNVRLEKSEEYLKNTELSVTDIAERTGFSDGNYFAKAFKKKYGISPTDYRKDSQKHE